MAFGFDEAMLIMATVLFALTGGMVPIPVGIQPVGGAFFLLWRFQLGRAFRARAVTFYLSNVLARFAKIVALQMNSQILP